MMFRTRPDELCLEQVTVVPSVKDQTCSADELEPPVMKKASCVINPEDSVFLRRWDFVTVFAMLFVCFVTPFEVAFLNDTKDEHYLASGADVTFWFNKIIDSIFVVDMVLQFFIMYGVANKYGVTYVRHHRLIVKHYLRTWFCIDFVSIIPFDTVGVLIGTSSFARLRILRSVRLARLLKLARLFRGLRILHRWELEVSFSYRKVTLWQLFATVCLAAHWISCTLGLISSLQGKVCQGDENKEDDCVVTWFSEAAAEIVSSGNEVTALRSYLVALHVTSTILVHPHGASPTSDAERLCFIIFVFVGGFVWTRVISRSTAVQTSLDRHNIHYRQTMDDLNMSAEDMKLSNKLKKRMRAFFLNTKDCSQQDTWTGLVKRMSPALQAEVAVDMHRTWLYRVRYLWGLPRLFIKDLAQSINMVHYAQNEVFGENFTLYIIHRGLCSKATQRRLGIRILRPGSVWGEEHLLLNACRLLEPNTARALSFTEVMVLKRDSFEDVCRKHPETYGKFRKQYLKCTLIHGIIYAAKQERKNRALLRRSTSTSLLENSHKTGSDDDDSIYDAREYCHHKRLRRQETSLWSTLGSPIGAQDLVVASSGSCPQDRNQSPQSASRVEPSVGPIEQPLSQHILWLDEHSNRQDRNSIPLFQQAPEWDEASTVASVRGNGAGAKSIQEMEDRLCAQIANMESRQTSEMARVSADVAKLRVAVEAVLAHLNGQSHPHSPCLLADRKASLS